MSLWSDLWHGNFGNVGNDIADAPSSLINHPTELAETLGGAAALATGGLALGGLGALGAGEAGAAGLADLGASGAAGGAGDILTGGSALGISQDAFGAASAAGQAGLDALSPGAGGALGYAAEIDPTAAAAGANPLAGGSLDASSLGFENASAFDPATFATAGQPTAPDFSLPTGGDPTSFDPGAAAGNPIASGPMDVTDSGDLIPQGDATLPAGSTVSDLGGGAAGGGPADALPPATNIGGTASAANAPAAPAVNQGISVGGDAAGVSGMTPNEVSAATNPNGIAPATSAAGGGVGDLFTAKNALSLAGPLAAAGMLGYTALKGPAPLPAQANQLNAATGPLQNLATTDLNMGAANQLTPAQAANIAQQQAQLTSQWKQVLMNQGVTNPEQDSRWPQIQAQIDQQITAATQSMIQTTIQTGLSAQGQVNSNLLGLAQMQVQQDTNYTNAIGNAVRALGASASIGGLFQKIAA